MKVLNIRKIRNCRQIDIMYDLEFDYEITKHFIDHLAKIAACEYFPNFPKPFFRIYLHEHLMIKGSVGNSIVRVVVLNLIYSQSVKESIENFIVHAEGYTR
ncbi:MAG: hypothetical protein NT007_00845 [Candidatus Kapabacteria bacterium]|nr:hypothetical protein [Candidatus Kapabacteria bacterium]